VTVIWALTGSGYYWPMSVWLGAAVTVALHAIGWRVARLPKGPRRPVEAHALTASTIGLVLVMLWALTDRDVFWPAWPLLGLSAVVAAHAARDGVAGLDQLRH